MPPCAACAACGQAGAPLRRCTRDHLCEACRRSPEHRIVTFAQARMDTGLPDEELLPFRLGTVPNCANPRFRPQPVLYWKDLASLCLANGLEIPE